MGVYDLSSLPISGTYYLEIIILLCERYSEEYIRNTTTNLATVCLENPVEGANRITQANGSVQIQLLQIEDEKNFSFPFVASSQHRRQQRMLDESSGPTGQWVHKSLVETKTHTNDPWNDSNIPLYTQCVNKQCSRSRCFHWNNTKEEKRGQECQSCVPALVSGVSNSKMPTSLLKDIVGTHATDEDSKEVLSLVDTSFLIDPVWDSAADMSQYDGNTAIGVMEAKYILWKNFSERKNDGKPLEHAVAITKEGGTSSIGDEGNIDSTTNKTKHNSNRVTRCLCCLIRQIRNSNTVFVLPK